MQKWLFKIVRNDGGCNCRPTQPCPMNGKCQTRSVVYTGMMESDNPNPMITSSVVHGYFGSTEGTFKTRYNGHKFNIEHRESKHTTLSAKYWQLKDENLNPSITWKISHKAHAYQPGKTCGCDLCLTEKVVILLGHDGPEKIPRSTILLNRRTELLQKCRHKRKFTYAGMTSRQKKWNYEYPGNPTGTEDWKRKLWGEGSPMDQDFFLIYLILCEMALTETVNYWLKIVDKTTWNSEYQ